MEKINLNIDMLGNVFEVIEEVLGMLSPSVSKAIATTKTGTKISAYRVGSNIIRIDINKQS